MLIGGVGGVDLVVVWELVLALVGVVGHVVGIARNSLNLGISIRCARIQYPETLCCEDEVEQEKCSIGRVFSWLEV